MSYAPIALFTYSRADHTKRAVESLLHNAEAKDSDLFVFSDGPKTPAKAAAVQGNRDYVHTITGFKSVTIIERETNWGLANSLIAGITEVINKYEKVIVVEDDLILSPFFLQFMNEGLEKYKDDERVGTISAYLPPLDEKLPDTFLLMYFQCWGWATWKRAWDLFNPDTKYLLRKLRFKKTKFDVGGGCGNYGNLLCHKYGLVDTWYLRYYASLFLKGKLSLYPGMSMATNEGCDGTGTHCKASSKAAIQKHVSHQPIAIQDIPVEENNHAYTIFKRYFDHRIKKGPKAHYENLKSLVRRLLYIDCF